MRVAIPEPDTEGGLIAARTSKPETEASRFTVLANPFRYVIAIVEVAVAVPEEGAAMLRKLRSAVIEKSGPVTKTTILAKSDNGPLSPSTSAKYVPCTVLAGADTVRMDVPEPAMLVDDSERVSPGGLALLTRLTIPVNPLSGVTVIVEVQVEPSAATVRNVGFAESSKSGPFTVTNTSTETLKVAVETVTVAE